MIQKVFNKKIVVFPLVDNCCQMEWLSFQLPRYQYQLGFELYMAEKASEANVLLVSGELNEKNRQEVLGSFSKLQSNSSIVAMGYCQISGFSKTKDATRVDDLFPVDYALAGCPPSPTQLVEVFQEIYRKRVGASRVGDGKVGDYANGH